MFAKFFRRSPPLKDTLDDTILRLSQQKKKLDLLGCKVKARERTLFESCTSALQRKDPERARIFSNELTEVKKIAKTINNGILLLEQLIIRMETLREVGSTFAQLRPTLEVVKEISGQLSEVMPEVSNELSHIGSILDEAMVGMSIDVSQDSAVRIPESIMGDRILEEASDFLRNKIEDEIPVPPIVERQARAIAIGGEEEEMAYDEAPVPRVVKNITENMGDKEGALLVYLRANGGEFEMSGASNCTKVPEGEIPAIIEGLSRKGLIKIMPV
jgi:division protein CdvB (Snf7/Vps24/ESCRT-III family)